MPRASGSNSSSSPSSTSAYSAPEIFSRTTIGIATASETFDARSSVEISLDAASRIAVPVITRESSPPSVSGIEICRTASSSPPCEEKPTAFHAPMAPPRATSSAAREE